MALPKIEHPIFSLKIPSTGKEIKYRAFLVREHKLILKAIEFNDQSNFITTIKGIVENCTFGEADVKNLTMYDVDYIFLKIRAKSIGEEVPAKYKCNNIVEYTEKDEEGNETHGTRKCGHSFNVVMNLDDVEVAYPKDYQAKKIIPVSDTVGIKLRSPTFENFRKIEKESNGMFSVADEFLFACIECIYNGDTVSSPGIDFSLEELVEFLDDVPGVIIEKINEFFEETPYVHLMLDVKCARCGNRETVEVKGLDDFFG